ncbi:D-galactarate dehydratase [Pantoea agglomerans]|uniref:galactarate dehydratase n=1 Tax=Enterobacter agglomerans TaxID=549 RepID=A0A379ACF7_ENTAG|nr:D-galactarate dehydratase [Pantoea agglomerans]
MNPKTDEQPLYIKVHEHDNVAIVVNSLGLPAGTQFADGLTLTEHVPQGHKVALSAINQGAEIVRYGEVIGYALRDIAQGSWIDESLVALPEAPSAGESAVSHSGSA